MSLFESPDQGLLEFLKFGLVSGVLRQIPGLFRVTLQMVEGVRDSGWGMAGGITQSQVSLASSENVLPVSRAQHHPVVHQIFAENRIAMCPGSAMDDWNKALSLKAGHPADVQLLEDCWHKIHEFNQGLAELYLASACTPPNNQ